ncbi:MAG: choice-of-anchor D domain-containing protein, partial [Verrucomicrobia bacterium]
LDDDFPPDWGLRGRDVDHNDFTPSDAEATTFRTSSGQDSIGTGTEASKAITIRNTGDGGLDVQPPFVTGPDAGHFYISSFVSLTNIAPGNDRSFNLNYRPTSPGTHQVQVIIPSNDGDEGLFRFDVRGMAEDRPRIEFQRNVSIPGHIPIWVDSDEVPFDFGPELLGSSAFRQYRMRNRGNASAAISSWTVSNEEFEVTGLPASFQLAAGGEREFSVVFKPVTLARHQDVELEFFTATSSTVLASTSVEGTGVGPLLLIEGLGIDGNYREVTDGSTTPRSTDGTDFDRWNVDGGKLDHTFRITNAGNRTLTINGREITGNNPGHFDVSGLLIGGFLNINPGNSQTFSIGFNPDSVGQKTATIVIRSDDQLTGAFSFRVTGQSFGYPEIEVKGRSGALDPFNDITDGDTTTRTTDGTAFGNVAVTNDSKTRTFKIKNTGTDALNIESVTENSPHFTLSSALTSIPAGGEGDFTVTFNPSAHGTFIATVEIECDDANESTFTFDVSGTGRAPDMELRGGAGQNTVITDGDNAPSATDFTDFGVVNISGATLPRTFAIRNLGNEPLQVTAMNSTDGQFVISGLSLPLNLAAGAVQNFQITFDPSSLGQKFATISFTSNDPDEATYNFRVTGYGGNDQPEIQVIGDNSTSLTSGQTAVTVTAGTDFGSVTAGTGSASRTFTIYNSGTGPLTISSITDNAPAFAISGAPTTVGALSSGSFTVTYSPALAATHLATITIANNDADEAVFTFAVRGTGVAAPPPTKPEIGLFGGATLANAIGSGDTSPTEAKGTDLGEVEIGSSITKTFRIRNTGTADLTVSAAAFASAPRFIVAGVASSIPAGGFDDFTVTYTPTNEGPTTRVLTITNSDENEAAYAITFTAMAVAPPGTLAVTNLAPTGKKMSLTFISIPGRTYRIVRSDDLETWVSVADLTGIPGDAEPQSYALAKGSTGRRFWRVEQE